MDWSIGLLPNALSIASVIRLMSAASWFSSVKIRHVSIAVPSRRNERMSAFNRFFKPNGQVVKIAGNLRHCGVSRSVIRVRVARTELKADLKIPRF